MRASLRVHEKPRSRWSFWRLPIRQGLNERARREVLAVRPIEDARNPLAGVRQLDRHVTVCIARSKPTTRIDGYLLLPADEGPQIHHGAIDAPNGQAHVLRKLLRMPRRPVPRPVRRCGNDEESRCGDLPSHQITRLGPPENEKDIDATCLLFRHTSEITDVDLYLRITCVEACKGRFSQVFEPMVSTPGDH